MYDYSYTPYIYNIPSSLAHVSFLGNDSIGYGGSTSHSSNYGYFETTFGILRYCTGIKTITIGANVTGIPARAFEGCSGLTDIYYQGTKAQWNAIDKGANWNLNTGSYTIHCTDGDIVK